MTTRGPATGIPQGSTADEGAGRDRLFLAGACLVYLVLAWYRLGAQSLWLDETMSLVMVQGTFGEMFRWFVALPEQHPLYSLPLRAWLVFGDSEVALRSLSVVFGLGGVVGIWFLARRVTTDRVTARIAAGMLAISPFWIYFAQEARPYELLGLVVILSTLALARWLDEGRRRDAVAYVVLGILGMHTHFFFVFVLGAQALVILVSSGGLKKGLLRAVAVNVPIMIAYLPWAWLVYLSLPNDQPWKGTEHVLFGIPYTLLRFAVGYAEVAPNVGWKERLGPLIREDAAILALAAVTHGTLMVLGIRKLWERPDRGRIVLGTCFGPMLLALAVAPIIIMIGDRYFMVSFPFYLILLAAGVSSLRPARHGWGPWAPALAAAYVVVSGWALYDYYHDPEFGKEQWKEVAAFVDERARSDDLTVVVSGFAIRSFDYYYSRVDGPGTVVPGDRLTDAQVASADRIWIVLSHAGDGSAVLQRFLDTHLVETERFYPKETGIRVLGLVRRPEAS